MKLVEFGSLCQLQNGRAFKPSEWSNSGYPIVRIQNLNDETKEFNFCNFNVEDKFYINDGDLLFSWSGTPGTSFGAFIWNRGKAVLNQHIFRVDLNDNVDRDYLKYAINHKLDEIIFQSHGGVGLKHITKGKLEAVKLPYFPLSTQTQIAKILDKSTALIAKRKAQIAELDVLVQSVFLEMFGDPITNPKNWEIGKIKDVILKSQYGTSNKASETEGEYPILRMNNITYQGEMDYSNLKYIDLDEKDKEKYLVHKGELLFNRTNSKELVGKTGLYNLDKPMAFAGYLIKIIPNKEKINSQFLLAYMNSKYIKAILFNMAKNIIGMANINAKEMENISLYIPELNLQTQFAQIVEKIQTQKSQLQQSLAELEMQHQALMQRAFRGELV
nr:restriction endonuclease subunit S [uncultured Haemophilus sp.]